MKNTFDLQDEIMGLLINDGTICTLLGITDKTNIADINNKIRREIQTLDQITGAPNLFLVYVFIPTVSGVQNNYLVNKNTLEFIIYGKYRTAIKNLYKEVKSLLQSNYEDMRIVSEGQISSGVVGIESYLFRVKPLTES